MSYSTKNTIQRGSPKKNEDLLDVRLGSAKDMHLSLDNRNKNSQKGIKMSSIGTRASQRDAL